MKLGRWDTTAANNTTTPPDGWPEGQAPSTVNDCAREMMASIRTAFQDLQFFDQDLSPTYISASSFSVPGNQTSAIHANRRLKLFDASTVYATVTTATFTAVTTIHISADGGGVLSGSLSSFALSVLSFNNDALPRNLSLYAGGGAGGSDASHTSVQVTTSLSVGGTTNLTGAVHVGGELSVSATATFSGPVNFDGFVTFNSDVSISGNLIVAALGIAATLTVSGATALGGTLSVSAAATLNSTLTVSGATVLKGNLDVAGNLSVGGTMAFNNISIAGTLTVSSAAVLKGAVSIGGALGVNSTFSVGGAAAFSSAVTFNGDGNYASGTILSVNAALRNWVEITVSGGFPSIASSYRMSSVTDTGVGQYTFTFLNAAPSTSYFILAFVENDGVAHMLAAHNAGDTRTVNQYLVSSITLLGTVSDCSALTLGRTWAV